MSDLFLDDIDAAVRALVDCGYPTLARSVLRLVERAEALAEVVDDMHDRPGAVYVLAERGPRPA